MSISSVGTPSFAWQANFPGGGGSTVTLTDPGVAGAFLIVALQSVNGGPGETCTPPDGTWTQILSDFSDGGSNSTQTFVFYKNSAAGSGTYIFTTSITTIGVGGITAYSGVSLTSPINTSSTNVDNNLDTDPFSIVANTATSTVNGCMLIWIGFLTLNSPVGIDSWTPPSGYTQRIGTYDTSSTNSASVALSIADLLQVTAGATGSVTGSDTRGGATTAVTVGSLVILAPSAAAASVIAINQNVFFSFGSGSTS